MIRYTVIFTNPKLLSISLPDRPAFHIPMIQFLVEFSTSFLLVFGAIFIMNVMENERLEK